MEYTNYDADNIEIPQKRMKTISIDKLKNLIDQKQHEVIAEYFSESPVIIEKIGFELDSKYGNITREQDEYKYEQKIDEFIERLKSEIDLIKCEVCGKVNSRKNFSRDVYHKGTNVLVFKTNDVIMKKFHDICRDCYKKELKILAQDPNFSMVNTLKKVGSTKEELENIENIEKIENTENIE